MWRSSALACRMRYWVQRLIVSFDDSVDLGIPFRGLACISMTISRWHHCFRVAFRSYIDLAFWCKVTAVSVTALALFGVVPAGGWGWHHSIAAGAGGVDAAPATMWRSTTASRHELASRHVNVGALAGPYIAGCRNSAKRWSWELPLYLAQGYCSPPFFFRSLLWKMVPK